MYNQLRRIAVISDNCIDFYMETPGVEVVFDKEVNCYDHTLYLTDNIELANNLEQQKLPYVWFGKSSSSAKFCVEDPVQVDEWYFFQAYAHMKREPWCVYENDSFLVREITEADLPAMYEMYARPEVEQYVEGLYEYEEELEFTRSYIENMYNYYGYGLWLVFDKANGALVGRVGFSHREIDGEEKVELGYIIAADYQRQGIAYNLCRELIAIGRVYWGYGEIFVCCENKNTRSIGLAEKLGFGYYGACDNQVLYRLVSG